MIGKLKIHDEINEMNEIFVTGMKYCSKIQQQFTIEKLILLIQSCYSLTWIIYKKVKISKQIGFSHLNCFSIEDYLTIQETQILKKIDKDE